MKIQQIMGETIEGIVVRKNSVVILRSRVPMDPARHAKFGQQITKWGIAVGVRATFVPHDFDVLAIDDESGATLLQNEQAKTYVCGWARRARKSGSSNYSAATSTSRMPQCATTSTRSSKGTSTVTLETSRYDLAARPLRQRDGHLLDAWQSANPHAEQERRHVQAL